MQPDAQRLQILEYWEQYLSDFNLNDVPEIPFEYKQAHFIFDIGLFLDAQVQGIKATVCPSLRFAQNCVDRLKDFKAAVELLKH